MEPSPRKGWGKPDRQAAMRTHTFPATSGTVTGWIGLVAVAGLLVAVALTDRTAVGLRWALALLVVGLLIYAFLVRPRIVVRERTLVLVNPLEDVEIPLGLVDDFVVRSATYVHVGRKRYVGVAIGHKVRAMIRPPGEGSPSLLPRRVRAGTPTASSRPARPGTIDLLEGRVRASMSDARQLGETGGSVRRRPVWWLIASTVVLAVVLVLLLVL